MRDLLYILNELLPKIRIELDLTQCELGEILNCSQELISRIETKNREVSYELIFNLATISKTDFHYFKYIASKFKTKEDYFDFCELARIVDSDDLKNVQLLEDKLQNSSVKETLNYGEPMALVDYCEMLILYYKYRDYEQVVDDILKIFDWEEELLGSYIINTLKAGYYYGIFSLLIKSYIKINKLDIAINLCECFFSHVENVWEREDFMLSINTYLYRKYYIGLYIDYITAYSKLGDEREVVNLCTLALEKCSEINILQPMKFILKLKIIALCKLGSEKEAKFVFDELKVICKYSDQRFFIERFSEHLNKNYPEIYEYMSNSG